MVSTVRSTEDEVVYRDVGDGSNVVRGAVNVSEGGAMGDGRAGAVWRAVQS